MSRAGAGALLDDAARDELAVKHLDLVGRVVGRLVVRRPATLDRDDLLSVGTIGLLKAARTYEPLRGASFRTYAYMAIRAAVLDELRRHDPLPRGARARLKDLHRLEADYRAHSGRLPTPDEVADGLQLTSAEAEQLFLHAEEDRHLRQPPSGGEESFDPVDEAAPQPADDAARQEEVLLVEAAIRELNPRERQVVVLYHSEGLYLKEIGETLGVTESRICQILACAQRKIRVRVESAKRNPR